MDMCHVGVTLMGECHFEVTFCWLSFDGCMSLWIYF